MRRIRTAACRGQATAELVISLVAISAVFLGLTQVAVTGQKNVHNYLDARESAENLVRSIGVTSRSSVQSWQDGDDGLSYTADDKVSSGGGDTSDFANGLNSPVSLRDLESNGAYGFKTSITPLTSSGSAATAADLKEGSATESVPVDPAMKYLLFNVTSLSLSDKVYMPGVNLTDLAGAGGQSP